MVVYHSSPRTLATPLNLLTTLERQPRSVFAVTQVHRRATSAPGGYIHLTPPLLHPWPLQLRYSGAFQSKCIRTAVLPGVTNSSDSSRQQCSLREIGKPDRTMLSISATAPRPCAATGCTHSRAGGRPPGSTRDACTAVSKSFTLGQHCKRAHPAAHYSATMPSYWQKGVPAWQPDTETSGCRRHNRQTAASLALPCAMSGGVLPRQGAQTAPTPQLPPLAFTPGVPDQSAR